MVPSVQYMGGKARIAKDLARVMLELTPQRGTYLEPFLGGCHVLPLMAPHFDLSIASDVMPDVAMLWRDALAGWTPPTEVTREMYAELRHAEPSALRGFVGFGCSFGGKWFGGYASDNGRQLSYANGYAPVAAKAVLRQITSLDPARTVIRQRDYRDHAPAVGTVVYCDPPYANTTSYAGAPAWDADVFWSTMATWVAAGAIVFVSEYSAPADWIPVFGLPAPPESTDRKGFGSHKQRGQERLFMHVSQAPISIERSSSMPSKAETEAQGINAQRARDQALAQSALDAAAVPCDDVGSMSLSAALMAIVEGWRAEVISLEGVTKRGTTGRKAELRTAAGLLAQVAKDVAALPSPIGAGADADRRAAVANQQAERIATMGPLTANLPTDPNHWSALHTPLATTLQHEVTSADAAAAFAGIPGPDIPGSFGPGDRPLLHPTTMPAMDGGPDVPALFIGDTITPLATGKPEYAVGDQVTVGGIDFTKISDNPFPAMSPDQTEAVLAMNPQAFASALEIDRQQAVTDATAYQTSIGAYLSGATDVDPITQAGDPVQPTLEIFDPTPRATATPSRPRLTYGEASALWANLVPLDHKSFSQVETAEDCGMKSLLNRAARSNLIPAGQPQWASVGGTAFHSAIEQIETGILVAGGAGPETPSIIQSLWLGALDATIIGTETQTQTDRKDWRVANKGLEGFDWWRVEGERMVKMYLDYHTIERRQAASILRLKDAAGGPDRLAIELPFRLDVDGVADDGFIDQVWYDQASPTPFAVRDLKSGRSEPDTFQLAGYAWALSRQWSVPIEMFTGAFWLARKGIYSTPIVIAERHPWDEMVFRFHNAQRAEQAQIATPRVSGFCNGCEHKLLCPAGPR
jgi:DNA adenine methylase